MPRLDGNEKMPEAFHVQLFLRFALSFGAIIFSSTPRLLALCSTLYRLSPGGNAAVTTGSATPSSGTGWTDTNIKAGVKCTYTVRGISVDGKLSPGVDKTGVSAVAR